MPDKVDTTFTTTPSEALKLGQHIVNFKESPNYEYLDNQSCLSFFIGKRNDTTFYTFCHIIETNLLRIKLQKAIIRIKLMSTKVWGHNNQTRYFYCIKFVWAIKNFMEASPPYSASRNHGDILIWSICLKNNINEEMDQCVVIRAHNFISKGV